MSSSKTKKRKGAPSGAPSRAGGRSSRRRTGERGVAQRAAPPVALILVVLIALGTLGWWVQSKGPKPTPALTPEAPATAPATTTPSTPPPTQPTPPKSSTLPDGRPAAWAHVDRAAGATETMLQTLYWVDGRNGDRLEPIEVRLPKTAGKARAAVEQLLNPPRELTLESGFPAGTKLNDVRLTGAVLTVDLTTEVESVQGSAGANSIMATLVYSLTELPGVGAVRLTANGLPAVLHGVEWNDPISRDQLAQRNLFPVDNVIRFDGQ
ncbi:MAG TPA: GerMN domain-containing protein [Symbiobacteriaceae bacterium]|nr:GerMN domain-containing protein [Symbiobacteriaceae bacterium]